VINNIKHTIHYLLSGECFSDLTRKQLLYLGALVVFIVISVVISSDFSRDSVAYNYKFNTYGASGWEGLPIEIFSQEPFILVVCKLIYALGLGAIFIFIIHSIIALPVKFYLIDKHSKDRFLSLAYFSSYFFILHDATQIRFGMAVAFVYLGLHYLADNRKLVFSGIVLLAAILIHNAILVFILMLLFTSKKSLLWLLGMVAVSVLLYPININTTMLGLLGSVVDYFGIEGTRLNELYVYMRTPSSDLHLGIFSRHGLLIYVCAIVIYKYRNTFNSYETLCYNAYVLSIFFWILLKDAMDLQVRFNDMFGFSLVFLVPYIHKRLSIYVSEKNAYIILVLLFTAHLAKFIFHDKMVAL